MRVLHRRVIGAGILSCIVTLAVAVAVSAAVMNHKASSSHYYHENSQNEFESGQGADAVGNADIENNATRESEGNASHQADADTIAAPGSEQCLSSTSSVAAAPALKLSAADVTTAVAAIESNNFAQVQVSWLENGTAHTAGSLTDLPAWSTSKVPLVSAIYSAGLNESHETNIEAALRASDNAAAEAMWTALAGSDAERAAAVTAVLRTAGDATTTVPSVRLYAPYTIYGQTQWSTRSQLIFLCNIDAIPGASEIRSHMAATYDNQRWGIGAFPGSALKGGWGPTPQGGYTARQMGWILQDGTAVPIAIAAQASSFDASVNVVNQVAELFRPSTMY